MNNNCMPAQLDVSWKAPARVEDAVASRRVRVFLMDLLAIVPYYTGHLCAGLQDVDSLRVTFGSIRYGHDKAFFERMGLQADSTLLDISSRLPEGLGGIRRLLKACEYVLNLGFLLVRFLLRKPDLIHVQFLPLVKEGIPAERWFLTLVRALGIKVVYTVHNVLPHESGRRDKPAYQRIYELVDRFICHDVHARNRLLSEFQVSRDRICVIPHGPLFESSGQTDAAEARESLGLPREGCIVLFQGIIRPYKGVSFLLKAWKEAKAAGLKGTLVIVGTGDNDLLSSIQSEVGALGVESSIKLVFRFVAVEELDRYYEAADILTYPYSAVTTSGALMTGISHGKAMIATTLPAFEELLHDERDCLLVGYGDVSAFADALLRLSRSDELRIVLGQRLSATRRNLPTWSEIAQQTARCYTAALAESGGRIREHRPNVSQHGKGTE